MSFDALSNPGSLALADDFRSAELHEWGLHFHGYMGREFLDRFHTRETAFWLLSRDIRGGLVDLMMERFAGHFGFLPKSVGCYILDAWTLGYIKRAYPMVECAISNCFEEGVKMFHGNNHNWNLFSDGGPWAPFWPSKHCALIPATDADEAIDLVALPHLSRDMIMALTSRDDYFASHPGNLMRARINEGASCPYMLRFVDGWHRQVEFNGWGYLSVFVSSPWLLQRHWAVDQEEEVRQLYEQLLSKLATDSEAGRCRVSTMSDFAAEFRRASPVGRPTVCHWKDILSDSQREMVWVINSHFRLALDMNAGGAGVDLRVYGGRLDRNLGAEADGRWNGSYPFVISSELRGGHHQHHLGFELRHGEHRANSIERRGAAEIECLVAGQHWRISFGPVTYTLGNLSVSIATCWHVTERHTLRIEHFITEVSDPAAEIEIIDVFKGALGSTEYPEPMPAAALHLGSPDAANVRTVPLRLSGSAAVEADSGEAGVALPSAGVRIRLHCEEPTRPASIQDGTLFTPNFTLKLGRKLGVLQSLSSWLTFDPIPPTPH